MGITIKDLAKLAGVSRGTIDKALNNRPGISEVTRERILRMAEELEYQPNLMGKALVQGDKPIKIGAIVTPEYNPFVQLIKDGIAQAAEEYQPFNVSVITKEPVTMETSEKIWLLDQLVEDGVKAIAILPSNSPELVEKLNEISAKGISVLIFNSYVPGIDQLCFVGQNHYHGGRTAADLMRRSIPENAEIGIIMSSKELSCHNSRISGFQDYFAQFGDRYKIIEIFENKDLKDEAYALTLRMLNAHPELKGIYITGGGTIGVARALELTGNAKNIALICHDLLAENADYMRDGTIDFVVDQDGHKQGYMSIKILAEYLLKRAYPETSNFVIPITIYTGEAIS